MERFRSNLYTRKPSILLVISLIALCRNDASVLGSNSKVLEVPLGNQPIGVNPNLELLSTVRGELEGYQVSTNQTRTYGKDLTELPELSFKNDSTGQHEDGNIQDLPSKFETVSNSIGTNNISIEDEMSTSESRPLSKPLIDRLDVQDYPMVSDDESFDGGPESSYDEASSNLREQKVVKELTRILSKSMAGATDQVKLDRLENWKRRQKDRKVVKDNRAKLFEDLLNVAIQTHPEAAKKRGRLSENKYDGNVGKTMPILGGSMQNVDPDLAHDAEVVMQHLHGIASSFEGPSLSDSSDESGVSDDSESTTNDDTEASKGSNKRWQLMNDRPLTKKFRKIKKQLSQKRRQLDQIKKLFNVDPAKDENIVAEHTSSMSGKKDIDNYKEVGDFTIVDDSTNVSGKRRAKRSKVNELSTYLLENPEIISSAMAEFDADGGRSLTNGRHAGPIFPYRNVYPTASQKSAVFKIQEVGKTPLESYLARKSKSKVQDPVGLISRLNATRYRHLHNGGRSDVESDTALAMSDQPSSMSDEDTLLESLRKRQLINLMRLDMVLADRQQASNRSSIISNPASSFDNEAQRDNESDYSRYIASMKNSPKKPSGNLTNGEFEHHYLTMSPESMKIPNRWDGNVGHEKYDHTSNNNDNPFSSGRIFGKNQTLSRFKNWRDVGQSEASSSSWNDKSRAQVSLPPVPYDLSTGSSSNSIEAEQTNSSVSKSFKVDQQENLYKLKHKNSIGGRSIMPDPGISSSHSDPSDSESDSLRQRRLEAFTNRSVDSRNEQVYSEMNTDQDAEESADIDDRNNQDRYESSEYEKLVGEEPSRSTKLSIDYFSAYKNEINREQSEGRSRQSERRIGGSDLTEMDTNGSDIGAMWAK